MNKGRIARARAGCATVRPGFMCIAGKRCPNFRVLSDFRKDRGDFFRSCFRQTAAWRWIWAWRRWAT